jgi:hypothetical protein
MEQDGVEPGGKSAALIVAGQTFPGFDEGFGNEVFRHADIARQRDRLPEKAGLERFDQLAKRRRIPGAGARQKFAGRGCFDPFVADDHLYINPRGMEKGSKYRLRSKKEFASLIPAMI